MTEKIFAIYKPSGPTSHDIVDEVRKITGEKKVGHAGILDPLARGVLVVGVGREATKKLDEVVQKEKEYIAEIKFGEESSTDDDEGEKTKLKVSKFPSYKDVEKVVREFVGNIEQTPPAYSAIKIHGKKAYELSRKGKTLELKPRKIEIKEIEILDYKWPFLRIGVVTGPGVYIRALARDIGGKLGVGGYLVDLERTRVGEFTKEKAVDVSEIKLR
ncbi:MAG: tRNA pseudouridine(55) synthase TruB [Candidatus Portnoybacteria bacterium]|nr:tRNA pseudouridine(55) synthase TruB [Candidatus Portnoybacteria bacterium]